jgi:glycosyltransferase involved in cell wall biosynthesis
MIVVHVTHEAVEKIGGIGAVVAGLVTSEAYQKQVSRTILLGPLFSTEEPASERLGRGGKVLYSSVDCVEPSEYAEKFRAVERMYDVKFVYGTRKVHEPCDGRSVDAEVLLVELFHYNQERLNLFKGELFSKFNIPSQKFEDNWDFEQYVRLAEPGVEALKQLGADGADEPVVYLSHEYMGMPTALKAELSAQPNTRTVFYAHEVASVRPLVETMEGHDSSFYNILRQATDAGRTIEQVFPEVTSNYKHPLVKAARYCDHVFAVGDFVVDELRFCDSHFRTMNIDRVYNGIPARSLSLEQRKVSLDRMKQYAENLFGHRPDWVFTHVARPVRSKGLWRDLRVLHEMEPLLARRGESAVYFMLGTLAGQRPSKTVRQMERVYGWPVAHEIGYPDLAGGEEQLWEMFDAFNRDHERSVAVLVNQWDWSRQWCGQRMPEEMTFADIRTGTDVEFGLSVYEPFGISQFEGLSFGALCIVSNVCGCMGYARRTIAGREEFDNVIEGDFLDVPGEMDVEALRHMPTCVRDEIEAAEGRRLAERIVDRLPRDEQTLERRIRHGFALAGDMSWEHVVRDFFLPSLGRVATEV